MGGLDQYELIGEAIGHGPQPFFLGRRQFLGYAFSQHPLHLSVWGWVMRARDLPTVGEHGGTLYKNAWPSGELRFSI